ncbi:hypothetical protein M3Y99_01757700 [Aphelenchoides fujianensis]|nr:hypothetical protein M3Y99_01757700 [Aphelenchoides fujianensis]
MAQWSSGYGAVKIVPAVDLRSTPRHSARHLQHQHLKRLSTQSVRTEPPGGVSFQSSINPADVPINSAFYPQFNSAGGYVRNYAAHAYAGNTLDHPQHAQASGTLNPTLRKYQRFRTSPNKTAPVPSYQRYRGSRTDPPPENPRVDSRYFRSYSGPIKRPAPLYQKRREPRPVSYHYAENYGTTDSAFSNYYAQQLAGLYDFPSVSQLPPPPASTGVYGQTSAPQIPKVYVPNYSTATPAQQKKAAKKQRREEERRFVEGTYPIYARLGIKLAEFVFGLIAIGLILAPVRGLDLAAFFQKTQTEWQGVVLAIVAVLSVLAFFLLLTVYCANSRLLWRRFDIVNTAVSAFLYLVVTCIEAYYAACYPPNGAKIALVCYRLEWIIAAVVLFCEIVVYITDLIMSLRTGVSLL